MKVYSRPEVLEDHIAPAAIGAMPGEGNTFGQNNFPGGGDPFPPNVILTPVVGGGIPSPMEPSLPQRPLLTQIPDFHIRTVTFGPGGSLISGGPELDFRDPVFRDLLGGVETESTLVDDRISFLTDELSISTAVIGAIQSVVGEDRSDELVGLSSDEYEHTSGSAFLTSL